MLSVLPEELVECIVGHLDLESIRALRLTNRTAAHKCSNGYFSRLFRCRRVLLTKQSLENAAQMMATHGRYIQELCVVGAAQSEESATDPWATLEDHSEMLTDLFEALKRGLGNKSLGRLSHAVDIVEQPRRYGERIDYIRLARASLAAAEAIFKALQRSQLRIEKLDLARHYVPLNVFEHIQDLDSLGPSLRTIKALTLSFSHSLLAKNEEDRPSDPRHSEPIASLWKCLTMARAARSLDFHWFQLRGGNDDESEEDAARYKFFDDLRTVIATLPLETCALRGLNVTEASLSEFLNTTSARSLLLQHIRMKHGETYDPILDILARSKDSFNAFHLDDLLEGRGGHMLLYFKVPGKPKFPVKGGGSPNEVHRRGKRVRQRLTYDYGGRPLGSPEYHRWFDYQRRKFGPPGRGFLPPSMDWRNIALSRH